MLHCLVCVCANCRNHPANWVFVSRPGRLSTFSSSWSSRDLLGQVSVMMLLISGADKAHSLHNSGNGVEWWSIVNMWNWRWWRRPVSCQLINGERLVFFSDFLFHIKSTLDSSWTFSLQLCSIGWVWMAWNWRKHFINWKHPLGKLLFEWVRGYNNPFQNCFPKKKEEGNKTFLHVSGNRTKTEQYRTLNNALFTFKCSPPPLDCHENNLFQGLFPNDGIFPLVDIDWDGRTKMRWGKRKGNTAQRRGSFSMGRGLTNESTVFDRLCWHWKARNYRCFIQTLFFSNLRQRKSGAGRNSIKPLRICEWHLIDGNRFIIIHPTTAWLGWLIGCLEGGVLGCQKKNACAWSVPPTDVSFHYWIEWPDKWGRWL